ncbi:MAG: asparagine synthase, partial [Burkholderiales bacterium]|nr:asparagine synthase [Burkholderiales bacterium]
QDGQVAAHLSGGLDSSAITILAARILRLDNRKLLAYSFLSSMADAQDERPYVETVLDQEKDLLWCPVSIDDPESYVLPKMDCDQLLPLDNSDPDIRVCSDAARHGANMLLSGWGGDEGATFNGRGALAEALLRGHWHYLVHEILALRNTRDWSTFTILKGELLRYLLPHAVWNGSKRLFRKGPMIIDATYAFLRPEFANKAHGNKFLEGPNATMNQYGLLNGPHLTKRAEQWALMGSRYGLAVAYPMLDRRVVAFSLSLPSRLFLREGWKRRVYRDAMSGILPEKIRLRHQKLSPFPEIQDLMNHQRENLLSRMGAFRAHRRIAALFDLDVIEEKLSAPRLEADAYALKRILMAMNFILENSPVDRQVNH